MLQPLKIAIIGCGTTGLASAAFLARDGHEVSLFEQFDAPRPVGAGLMLQPTGLAILAQLGLDDKVISQGARITRLSGLTKQKKTIFDLSYQLLGEDCFALGVHRSSLFKVLYDHAKAQKLKLTSNARIKRVTTHADQTLSLIDENLTDYGPFDLIIDASGVRSVLVTEHSPSARFDYCEYGAVWTLLPDKGAVGGKDCLTQRYDGARHMAGLLPVGKAPGSRTREVALFWSLPRRQKSIFFAEGLEAFKAQLLRMWPEMDTLVGEIKSSHDLTFAEYGHRRLKPAYNGRIVFAGDAAHATSPQLGQGANQGLIDAYVLSQSLKAAPGIEDALADYVKKRAGQTQFYQTASRALTPFFQSDSRLAGVVRDLSFGHMCRMPWLNVEMMRTLGGMKTGLFSHMDPGSLHPRYALTKMPEPEVKPVEAQIAETPIIETPVETKVIAPRSIKPAATPRPRKSVKIAKQA